MNENELSRQIDNNFRTLYAKIDKIGKDAENKIKALEDENKLLKVQIEQLEIDKKALANNAISLGKVIKDKEKLWKYLESRFVKVCKECNEEEKAKCIMFPEYCEGQCTEIVDLLELINKGNAQMIS